MITRTPAGKFCSREGLLAAWLPMLLSWCWRTALETMLAGAARWCEEQAADEYEMSARATRQSQDGWRSNCLRDADKWIQRRDVLVATRATLEAIK